MSAKDMVWPLIPNMAYVAPLHRNQAAPLDRSRAAALQDCEFLPFKIRDVPVLLVQADGFLVDNSLLKSQVTGVTCRNSKNIEDRGERTIAFGSTIDGIAEESEDGEKWLKVTKGSGIVATWSYDDGMFHYDIQQDDLGSLKFVQTLNEHGTVHGELLKVSEDGVEWLVSPLPHGSIRLRLVEGAVLSQFKGDDMKCWGRAVTATKACADPSSQGAVATESGQLERQGGMQQKGYDEQVHSIVPELKERQTDQVEEKWQSRFRPTGLKISSSKRQGEMARCWSYFCLS